MLEAKALALGLSGGDQTVGVESLQRTGIVKYQKQNHETSYYNFIWSRTFPENENLKDNVTV